MSIRIQGFLHALLPHHVRALQRVGVNTSSAAAAEERPWQMTSTHIYIYRHTYIYIHTDAFCYLISLYIGISVYPNK